MERFIKKCRDPATAFLKCEMLHRISLESGLFASPRAIAYDEVLGTLELERLDSLVPLAYVFPQLRGEKAIALTSRIGEMLAILHGNWSLPDATVLSSDWLFSGMCRNNVPVLVHGDFGLGNVCCINGDAARLVILDPEPAPFLEMPVRAMAVPELDLAHFASCLEGVFPIRLYARYDWNGIVEARCGLIRGYTDVSGKSIASEDIILVAGRLLSRFADNLSGVSNPLQRSLFRAFLKHRAKRLLARTE